MLFINTRPVNRAENLSNFLRKQQITVLDLPLLMLQKCVLSNEDIDFFRVLLLEKKFRLVVLVSEEAVQHGLAMLYQTFLQLNSTQQCQAKEILKTIQWVAVGQKTADFFSDLYQQYWSLTFLKVIYPIDTNQQNNEGILNLSIIKNLQKNDKILIWRGHGGRELLIDTLTRREVDVKFINLYQRVLPSNSIDILRDNLKLIDKNSWVLLSSMTAWKNWQQLLIYLKSYPTQCNYLVLQSRIAKEVSQAVETKIIILSDLQPETVYQTILSLENRI